MGALNCFHVEVESTGLGVGADCSVAGVCKRA